MRKLQQLPRGAFALDVWTLLVFGTALLAAIACLKFIFGSEIATGQVLSLAALLVITLVWTWFVRAGVKDEISRWREGFKNYIHDFVSGRATRAGVDFEEARVALLAASRGAVRAGVAGVCALLVCRLTRLLPPDLPTEFVILLGALVGARLGWQIVRRKHPKALRYSDLEDGADFGACWGAGIAASASIIWNAIAYGSYDPERTWDSLVVGAFVATPVGVWWGAARSGSYPRIRLALSACLATLGGVSLILLSLRALPGFWQSVAHAFPGVFVDRERDLRILIAVGAAIGLAGWACWQFGRSMGVWARKRPLGNPGEIVDSVNDLLRRLGLAAIAALKLAVAGALAWFASLEWSGLSLFEALLWFVVAGTCWAGLSDLREALRLQPKMKFTGPYGNADLASERQAADYEARNGRPGPGRGRQF